METVPLSKSHEDFMNDYPNHYKLWVDSIQKMAHTKDQSNQQNFDEDTSWMPEFSKIISVSIGFLTPDGKRHIKSFSYHEEKKLLLEFKETLQKVEKLGFDICGHNIKKFHLPFINKRLIIMFSLGLESKNIMETKSSVSTLYWEEKDTTKIKEISEEYVDSLMDVTLKINSLND